MRIRLATWNLDRSGVRNRARWAEQLQAIRSRDALVWVFTEAHRDQSLGCGSAFSEPAEGFESGECTSAVWASGNVQKLDLVSDSRLSVCAEVEIDGGEASWLVYGTIIPYAADGAPHVPRWQRHRQACEQVIGDIERLRTTRPAQPMVLAGDFNMNLDGTQWYGLKDVKQKLSERLKALGMRCCTADDFRVGGLPRANIDHIWISPHLRQIGAPAVWYDPHLSDHNGVEVVVEVADPSGS